MNDEHPFRHLSTDCPRTRLAEGELAQIDVCRYGMFQVHIGAITLRLAECALSALVGTLNQAILASSELLRQKSACTPLKSRCQERGEA